MEKYICDNISKYNFTYIDTNYKTPPVLYQKALDRWGLDKFSLDTCCSDNNIPARWYCVHGTLDGLLANWSNYSWCNPPYNECKKWIEKLTKRI